MAILACAFLSGPCSVIYIIYYILQKIHTRGQKYVKRHIFGLVPITSGCRDIAGFADFAVVDVQVRKT